MVAEAVPRLPFTTTSALFKKSLRLDRLPFRAVTNLMYIISFSLFASGVVRLMVKLTVPAVLLSARTSLNVADVTCGVFVITTAFPVVV